MRPYISVSKNRFIKDLQNLNACRQMDDFLVPNSEILICLFKSSYAVRCSDTETQELTSCSLRVDFVSSLLSLPSVVAYNTDPFNFLQSLLLNADCELC